MPQIVGAQAGDGGGLGEPPPSLLDLDDVAALAIAREDVLRQRASSDANECSRSASRSTAAAPVRSAARRDRSSAWWSSPPLGPNASAEVECRPSAQASTSPLLAPVNKQQAEDVGSLPDRHRRSAPPLSRASSSRGEIALAPVPRSSSRRPSPDCRRAYVQRTASENILDSTATHRLAM